MMPTNRLTGKEYAAFLNAVTEIVGNAQMHKDKRPAMSTLLEEMAEAILSSRGKHKDYLTTEITQIGGICINILWQLKSGEEDHVCNIGTKNDKSGLRPVTKDKDE